MLWFCSTVFAATTNFLCASAVLVPSSSNGSPLESHELGDVVATITKKRRGNESNANFEINVGDGRYISLNDPTGLQALDSSMKATAASQLMVLQDQMASLMAQLTK
jgi:hypothetical protein